MSVLFSHACRYELFDRNPIHLVRQGAKRKKVPSFSHLLKSRCWSMDLAFENVHWCCLPLPLVCVRASCLVCNGAIVNFAERTMNVTRSIVYGVVGPCKTESSQRPVPLHPLILES